MDKPEFKLDSCPICGSKKLVYDRGYCLIADGQIWCKECEHQEKYSNWNNHPLVDSLQVEIEKLNKRILSDALKIKRLKGKPNTGTVQYVPTYFRILMDTAPLKPVNYEDISSDICEPLEEITYWPRSHPEDPEKEGVKIEHICNQCTTKIRVKILETIKKIRRQTDET